MFDDSKIAALVEEGLSEGEARYLTSGGSDTTGLELPSSSDDSAPSPAAAPSLEQRERAPDTDLAARENELRELREKSTRLDERMRVFREAMEAPDAAAVAAAQPKPMPDREADPFGFMAWQAERQEALERRLEQYETRTQERDAAVELTQTFRQDAGQYARTNPDFWESAPNARDGAYHYLMKSRDQELQAAGYTDPQERLRIITADERDIVARAFHAKQRNPSAPGPAEVLFNLATSRGYQRRAAAVPQRGAAPPRGAPAAQLGGFDLARIAEMTDNQYAAWKRALTPQQQKSFAAALGA
jgi:hypothetical protein